MAYFPLSSEGAEDKKGRNLFLCVKYGHPVRVKELHRASSSPSDCFFNGTSMVRSLIVVEGLHQYFFVILPPADGIYPSRIKQ